MSSLRHLFLSSKLWYRGLGLIINAGSRGLNTSLTSLTSRSSLIPTTIKSSSQLFSSSSGGNNDDDPISFKVWLKSLEIEGMDENKLNEFEKKEDVLTDMAQKGDPNNHIIAFAKGRGLTDEFVQGEIQHRMLSKYQSYLRIAADRKWHSVGPIWNTKSSFFVERATVQKELKAAILTKNANHLISGPRQIGKTTQIYQVIKELLSENYPILYHCFKSYNGGSDIYDVDKMYKYIMYGIKDFVDFCGTDYEISSYLSSNWDYNNTKHGLFALFDDINRIFGKMPILIIDELQAIRGSDPSEAKPQLQDNLQNITGVKLESFIGIGPTGLLRSNKDNDNLPKEWQVASVWKFDQYHMSTDFFFDINDIKLIINQLMNDNYFKHLFIIDNIDEFAKYLFLFTRGYPSLVQLFGDYLTMKHAPYFKRIYFKNTKDFNNMMIFNNHYQLFIDYVCSQQTFERYQNYINQTFLAQNQWNVLEALNVFLSLSVDVDMNNPTLKSNKLTLNDIGEEYKNELIILSDYGIISCISPKYDEFYKLSPIFRQIILNATWTYKHDLFPSELDLKYFINLSQNTSPIIQFDELYKTILLNENVLKLLKIIKEKCYSSSSNKTSEYGHQNLFESACGGYLKAFGQVSTDNARCRPDFLIQLQPPHTQTDKKIVVDLSLRIKTDPHDQDIVDIKEYKSKLNADEAWCITIDECQQETRRDLDRLIGVKRPLKDSTIHVMYIRIDSETLKLREIYCDGNKCY